MADLLDADMTIDLWEAYENEEIVKLTDNYRYVDNGQGTSLIRRIKKVLRINR